MKWRSLFKFENFLEFAEGSHKSIVFLHVSYCKTHKMCSKNNNILDIMKVASCIYVTLTVNAMNVFN